MGNLAKIGVLALAVGSAVVAVWRRRRARAAEKVAEARRFRSRRVTDREARRDETMARWDDDGGAQRPRT
jgi:hypothetical protein